MANMTTYWIWWAVLSIAGFGVGEGYAVANKLETLSQLVWRLSIAWPPTGYLFGFLAGFLAAHFFWPNQGLH